MEVLLQTQEAEDVACVEDSPLISRGLDRCPKTIPAQHIEHRLPVIATLSGPIRSIRQAVPAQPQIVSIHEHAMRRALSILSSECCGLHS